MFECVVCGTRTIHRVTLYQRDESIPICGERCSSVFLRDPLAYLGAEVEPVLWDPRP